MISYNSLMQKWHCKVSCWGNLIFLTDIENLWKKNDELVQKLTLVLREVRTFICLLFTDTNLYGMLCVL